LPALDVQIEAYKRRLIMAVLEDSRGSVAKRHSLAPSRVAD
jgi:hypothetical protein